VKQYVQPHLMTYLICCAKFAVDERPLLFGSKNANARELLAAFDFLTLTRFSRNGIFNLLGKITEELKGLSSLHFSCKRRLIKSRQIRILPPDVYKVISQKFDVTKTALWPILLGFYIKRRNSMHNFRINCYSYSSKLLEVQVYNMHVCYHKLT